jgi:hypothetical protein
MTRGVILRHTGNGPLHYDVVVAGGGRCPTIALLPGRPWRWRWQQPHRRRYLTYRGAVAGGRGRITRVWNGPVQILHGFLRIDGHLLRLRRDGVVVWHNAAHSPPCLR